MWVRIGDKCYYSHTNGTMKSTTNIHRIIVPQKDLDNAKAYLIADAHNDSELTVSAVKQLVRAFKK